MPRERLRDVAPVMLRSDAVDLGLFGPGPLSDRAAGRIGEVFAVSARQSALVAPVEMLDGAPPKRFRGLHGGLTSDEALVPLLALRV